MFQYVYSTKMVIIFDNNFKYEVDGTLDKAVNAIEYAVDAYGFSKADVIDKSTGEILVQWTEGDGKMTQWENNAKEIENTYGGYVDWEERFYQCPYCGEPIYECDWSNEELEEFICPVCEFEEDEDSENEDDDWDCDE